MIGIYDVINNWESKYNFFFKCLWKDEKGIVVVQDFIPVQLNWQVQFWCWKVYIGRV